MDVPFFNRTCGLARRKRSTWTYRGRVFVSHCADACSVEAAVGEHDSHWPTRLHLSEWPWGPEVSEKGRPMSDGELD